MAYFLFPLVLGIAACHYWWAYLSWLVLPFAVVNRRSHVVVIHWSLFFLLGLFLAINDDLKLEDHRFIDGTERLRACVVHSMKSHGSRHSILVWWLKEDCPIMVTVKGTDNLFLASGDTIIFKSALYRPSPPANPLEFDYPEYLKSRDILWCTSISENEMVTSPSHVTGIQRLAQIINRNLRTRFDQLNDHTLAAGLCKAIMLGDKGALSDDQKTIFSSTGTMHIMAVSGLHVGMIAGLLLLIFPTTNDRHSGFIKLLIYLICIWGFVLITGAKSSAIRAGTMFTIFFLSIWINRDGHAINSLLTAALLILLTDPDQLYDIGSQFSFTAVLSILLFQPWIATLLSPASIVASYIWQIVSVTLSVQILLAPISVLYFHSFPITFLISNLIAIPMAAGTLSLSIIYLVAEIWVESVSEPVSHILGGFVSLCFNGLKGLSGYSSWNIDDIWLQPFQLGFFYLATFLMARGILIQKPRSFRLSLIVILCATASIGWVNFEKFHSSCLIVYGYPLTGTIDIKSYGKWITIADRDRSLDSAWRSYYHCTGSTPHSSDTSWWISLDTMQILKLGNQPVEITDLPDILIAENDTILSQFLCELETWPSTIVYIDRYSNEKLEPIRHLASHHQTTWHSVAESGSFQITIPEVN